MQSTASRQVTIEVPSAKRRLMSRHIIINGVDYGLRIVRLDGFSVSIEPFQEEEEGIEYFDDPVVIEGVANLKKILIVK